MKELSLELQNFAKNSCRVIPHRIEKTEVDWDDLGTLTVDPMRLRQVLLNLSNACKFTKEGQVALRGA